MTAVYLIPKKSLKQIQNMSENVNLASNNITMRAISITALIM